MCVKSGKSDSADSVGTGALNLQDWILKDWILTDQIAGVDFDGPGF